MPTYRFRNRQTGEMIEMPWSGPRPPTPRDVDLYVRQNRESTLERLWRKANEPLTDLPSRVARRLTSLAPNTDNLNQSLNDFIPGLGTAHSMYQGFQKGVVEGIGDLASSLTSPLSLGLTAVTGGAGTAARLGLGGAAKALSAVEAGAGAGLAGHGAYNIATANSLPEAGAGLVEMAGGLLGARAGVGRIGHINNPPPPPPITNPRRLLAAENPQLPPSEPVPRFYAGQAGVADVKQKYTADMSTLQNPFSENAMSMTWGPEQIGEQVQIPARVAAEYGLGANRRPLNPIVEPVQPEVFNPVGDPRALAPGEIAPRNELPAIGRPENRRGVMAGVVRDMVNEELNLPGPDDAKVRANIPKLERGLQDIQDPNAPVPAQPGNVQQVNKPANPNVQAAKDLMQPQNKKALNLVARQMGLKPKDLRARLKQFIQDEGGFLDVDAIKEGLASLGRKIRGGIEEAKVKASIKASDVERTVPEAVPILQDWMGARAAANTRGVIEGRKFRKYDSSDIEKLIEYQENPEKFPDVAEYFTKGRERAIEADLALGLKENYLPQLWDNTPEEISEAFAKKFGTKFREADPLAAERQPQGRVTMKPSFTLKSVIENYKAGLEMGLKPRFKNISELVHWYEKSLNKAIADREFFFRLKDANLIRPAGKAPHGWVDLRSDFFPSFGRKGEARKLWRAHPDVVAAIENYIKQPKGILQASANLVQTSKDIALSSGVIPGTALNAHGINMLARNAAARGVLRGTLEGIKFMINTGSDNPVSRGIEKVAPWQSARAFLDQNLKDAPKFVEAGLNLSTEGFKFGEPRHKNAFLKLHGKFFEDPLFQNMVPAIKVKHAKDVFAQLTKEGMGEKQALREASRITNEMYGGINVDQMFRDKSFQNVMRTLLIAPDWLESNARVGKGMVTSFGKDPTKGPYRQMALGFLGSYIMANVANVALTGKPMFMNDPGHTLQIDTGQTIKSQGRTKKVYINPFGTAFDAIRLPAETIAAIAKGDTSAAGRILRNRLSMPVASVGNVLFNEDWRGRELGGKDAYGRQIPMSEQIQRQVSNLTDPFTPQYLAAGREMLMDEVAPLEAMFGAVEAPVRFGSVPRRRNTSRGRSGRRPRGR